MRFCSASSRRRPILISPVIPVAPAGDHAVGGRLLTVHGPLREVRPGVDAHLDERARVDEQVDALARRQLAGVVLLLNLLLAAAELRLLAARVQLVGEALELAL